MWDGYKHFFNRLTGSFYSGLLGYVIPKLSHDYFIVDERTPVPSQNNPLSLNGIELRDYQLRMIGDALHHERGIISAPPNAGKTEIACGIIQVLGLPTVFLTHRITLLDQTKSRFEKRLGIEAGIFGAKQRSFKDVNVMSIVSVYKELDNPEILNILKQSPVVISDECHRVSGNMWATILQKCPAFYRYGLSATALMRDEVSNMTIRGMTGDEITSVTNQELTEWGISARASVYLFDMNKFGGPVLSKRHTFDDAYDTGIVNNPQRNTLIVDSARHFLDVGKSVFIIVHCIEHGRILSEIFRRVGLEVPFISGEENLDFIRSRLKEFEKRTLKCLVSSSISDEGLDIPCHPSDEFILKNGFDPTPICELKIGDLVRSHTGQLRKILNIGVHKSKEEIIKIYLLRNSYPLTVTKLHKLPVLREGEVVWVFAKDVKEVDELLYSLPKRIATISSINISDFINTSDLLKLNGYMWSRYSNTIRKETATQVSKKFGIGVNIVRNFLKRTRDGVKCRGRNSEILCRYYKNYWGQQKKVKDKIELSADFCRLLGYYISEGSICNNTIYFSFHSKEKEYQLDVIRLIKEIFNETAVLEIKGSGARIWFCNRVLSDFLNITCGRGARNKRIPDFIFNTSLNNKRNLIVGMWRGDGSDKSRRSLSYSSVSKKLLFHLRELLMDFGIIAGIKYGKRGDADSTLDVSGLEWIKLCKLLGISKIDYNIRKTHSKHRIINNQYIAFRIKNIEKIPHTGNVFSLKIDGDETYTTCTATVHNSMDVLILGVGNKSALKTIQRVGRGLRKKDIGENIVSIIDFIDRCSPYLYRHSIARSRVYVSMDLQIHEVLDRDWKEVVER